MPLNCATDCTFRDVEQDNVDAASSSEEGESPLSSSSSSLSQTSTSDIFCITGTIFADASAELEAPDDAFAQKDTACAVPSDDDGAVKHKEEEEEDGDKDPHTSIHASSPSSVYSNDNPLEEHGNSFNTFQDSDHDSNGWNFLDHVHVAIVAWLDAGGLDMARLGHVPVFKSGSCGKGRRRRRRHSV